jgi:hypothetical protein
LDTKSLEAALPDQFSVYPDVAQPRMRKAWDASDTEICLSEQWPSVWCAKAVSVGLSAFTDMEDRELAVQMISFPDVKTAADAFKGEGTVDEVGKNPPGDEIDGFEIEDPDGGTVPAGRGIGVRKGAVVAKIHYTWAEGASVEPGALISLTKMVVRRVEQAQLGENPTAFVQ